MAFDAHIRLKKSILVLVISCLVYGSGAGDRFSVYIVFTLPDECACPRGTASDIDRIPAGDPCDMHQVGVRITWPPTFSRFCLKGGNDVVEVAT